MKTSEVGKSFIKSFESFRSKMYLDQAGRPTIAWGHLIEKDDPFGFMDRIITLEEAERLFESDLYIKSEMCLDHYVKIPLNSFEYDALASLVFNIGCGAFVTSTLLRKLQLEPQWTREDVSNEFLRWNKIKKAGVLTESAGLTRRRKAEREMFLGRKYDL